MYIQQSVSKVFLKIFEMEIDNFKINEIMFGEDPWDSMKHVQLILELEASFGISIELGDVLKIKTFKDAVDLVINLTTKEKDATRLLEVTQHNNVKIQYSFLCSCEIFPIVNSINDLAERMGNSCEIKTLPFNTLQQYIRTQNAGENEVFFLLPWDFLPELDWRTGISPNSDSEPVLNARVEDVYSILAQRNKAKFIYLPAPILPISHQPNISKNISQLIMRMAIQLQADILSPDDFGVSSYLSSGFPLLGSRVSKISKEIYYLFKNTQSYKVLVTDLDNVLWQGVISEDGIDQIEFESKGNGWASYIYQSLLRRLKKEGVLLAAVSRNRSEEALIPFQSKRMILAEDDFVAILASYHAKSSQIKMISDQLSVSLLDFVFVDDSDIELEEVTRALPDVKLVKFPQSIADFPLFINYLSSCFEKESVTGEDLQRTELYRQKAAFQIPNDSKGSDLSEYLQSLKMRLKISDVSDLSKDRAVQLINKTNQFNINGKRKTLKEIESVIQNGGRLYTAELEDRFGSHGEVVACLIDSNCHIQNYVISCRVLQRRVEYAFLAELLKYGTNIVGINYLKTDRNIPATDFINIVCESGAGESLFFDADKFLQNHRNYLNLIDALWIKIQ